MHWSGALHLRLLLLEIIGCSSEGWYDTSYQPSDEQPIVLEVKYVMMKDVKELYDQIQARNVVGG
jgi:hypothetical protein